ncbi:5'-methylthioadenosine/adenosylhomocysteine nucleosidase [Parendozoicomonas haliclonae]|uniref:adenosylhomocysteine nucleosidase n=1 Tax=Parendozoicomonas haliclonae TaxID=1960125 RepID=A0A1X7APF0_9GAMM|nr:5'-methylthioadenosine/adenosylhomocysteine nucleosidase [Parendozoicomonas haliclonae]SMA50201.1 Aminodeoxyfutalosine nucleosidase [Parendozoicomonas haliclonae]
MLLKEKESHQSPAASLDAPPLSDAARPETIAIIGAMDVEIEKLLPDIQNRQEVTLRGHIYHTGTLCGQNVVVTRSGVGKVNAAVTTTELIKEFHVDSLIFTGIAGGVSPQVSPSDVVISTALVQHDVDLTTFGLQPGLLNGFSDRHFYADQRLINIAVLAAHEVVGEDNVHLGIIATGDQFMADRQGVRNVYEEYQAMAVEMEGAAVAQVAFLYNKPLVVIRTISDKADGTAHLDYHQMKASTAHNSSGITLKMLAMMKD